jgi:hypothetical protein
MGAWHENEDISSRSNSTTTRTTVGKLATVQKRSAMNVFVSPLQDGRTSC